MAFRPLHDRVLVRRIEADQKTAGGIIIPDSAQEKPSEGEIVAAGEGTRDDDGDRIPLDVKAGDRVFIARQHIVFGNGRWVHKAIGDSRRYRFVAIRADDGYSINAVIIRAALGGIARRRPCDKARIWVKGHPAW